MNITLYNPPMFHYSSAQSDTFPLLSLPILSAILNKSGYKTSVIDMEAKRMHPKNVSLDADIVGLSCLTCNKQGVKDIIKYLHKGGYKGIIIAGGVYATLFPEEVLEWGVDLVVTGECEGNVVELIKSGARGIHRGRAMQIGDIPIPDWTHHDPNTLKYRGNMSIFKDSPGITMWTRGCPYQCIFCENIIYQKQPTRYRPPKNIEQEMCELHARGHRDIMVYDDELVGAKAPDGWMSDIADRIGNLGFNMVTQGRCSKRYITPDVMANAKRAGINTIFWGVESLSQKILDAMKKHTTIEDIWHTLTVTKSANIRNGLYVQVGSYQEDENDLQITAKGLMELYKSGLIDYINVFTTSVMPGTELARMAQKEGWYKPLPDGWRTMKKPKTGTPWLPVNKIYEWKDRYKEICPTPTL